MCRHTEERLLPSTNLPRTACKCPLCGRRTLKRDLLKTISTVELNTGAIAYSNRFPYVSKSMPFGGDLAGQGRHVGPNKQIEVQNSRHEQALRAVHGYGGESAIQ